MEETPPLPLPLKGGEYLRTKRKQLPSLQGEGQGWGLYIYSAYLFALFLVNSILFVLKITCKDTLYF